MHHFSDEIVVIPHSETGDMTSQSPKSWLLNLIEPVRILRQPWDSIACGYVTASKTNVTRTCNSQAETATLQ